MGHPSARKRDANWLPFRKVCSSSRPQLSLLILQSLISSRSSSWGLIPRSPVERERERTGTNVVHKESNSYQSNTNLLNLCQWVSQSVIQSLPWPQTTTTMRLREEHKERCFLSWCCQPRNYQQASQDIEETLAKFFVLNLYLHIPFSQRTIEIKSKKWLYTGNSFNWMLWSVVRIYCRIIWDASR